VKRKLKMNRVYLEKLRYSNTRGWGGGAFPYMAYMGTGHWIGYGFWPVCREQDIQFYAIVCPKRGTVTRLSPLNMAYRVFSNPRSETFAVPKTLKNCMKQESV